MLRHSPPGRLEGPWLQAIYSTDAPGEVIVKADNVTCHHKGDIIEADIQRFAPARGPQWHFNGRYRNHNIFGHYWAKDELVASDGVIFLSHRGEGRFQGWYMKLARLTSGTEFDKPEQVSIERIPLAWFIEGSAEATSLRESRGWARR